VTWCLVNLIHPERPEAFPLIYPERFGGEAETVGYSITYACPTGCFHSIAMEPTWDETLAVARDRIAAHLVHAGGVLVAAWWPLADREAFDTQRSELATVLRGTTR